VLIEGRAAEDLVAVCAVEVLGMPLLSEGIDGIAGDGLATGTALGCKATVEVAFAVWFAVSFEELARRERCIALLTDEMVGMPFAAKGGNAAISDGLVAMPAARAKECLITILALRRALNFKEVASSEGDVAVVADEVVDVEYLAHGADHLAQDRILAIVANSFGRDVAVIKAFHLGLQVRQQGIQLVLLKLSLGRRCRV